MTYSVAPEPALRWSVGAEEFVVAVPLGRCEEPVRTYTTFTSGVHALRDWLLECGIMMY
jgi:hypothetical protein